MFARSKIYYYAVIEELYRPIKHYEDRMQQQLLIEIVDWYGPINNHDELPSEKGSEETKQGGHG